MLDVDPMTVPLSDVVDDLVMLRIVWDAKFVSDNDGVGDVVGDLEPDTEFVRVGSPEELSELLDESEDVGVTVLDSDTSCDDDIDMEKETDEDPDRDGESVGVSVTSSEKVPEALRLELGEFDME